MLTRSLRARGKRTCSTLPHSSRPVQRAYSSGSDSHHVTVDLSHLERPAVKSSELLAYLGPNEILNDDSPISPNNVKANHGYLLQSEYHPNADWTDQILSNVSVLECIADFTSTEFRIPKAQLNAHALQAKYREQYANFVLNRAPAMNKAGVSKLILDKLRDVYRLRSLVTEREIDQALVSVFNILMDAGQKGENFRVTFNGQDEWPIWKFFEMRLPGMGEKLAIENRSADQYQGKHALTNAEQAKQNVLMFQGSRAFMKAIDRGLTDEERRKVKEIIMQNPLDDGLDDITRAQVDALVGELIALPKETAEDNKILTDRLRQAWKAFGNEDLGLRKLYFFRQYTKHFAVPDHMYNAALNKEYKPQPGDVILEEGEDYFTDVAQAEAKKAEMKDTLLAFVENAHKQVLAKGDKTKIAESEKLSAAVTALLNPSLQADLELMHLLETTRITDRRLAQIASVFAPAQDLANDELLNDVLNPHPVAQKLFGPRIEVLCTEYTHYTEEYSAGAETLWHREKDWPRPDLTNVDWDDMALPLPVKYNSPTDSIYHMKLFRLADDFLGLNLDSDDGILAFENFVHTYDISPGEATLERCLPSPPPSHTYAELPIIKFDGWDDADSVPEEIQVTISAEKVANQ